MPRPSPRLRAAAVVALAALAVGAQAQPFALDSDVPALAVTDSTQLTLLTAPFGSRFSLSPRYAEGGVRTGTLGFDHDAFERLLIEVKTDDGARHAFRLAPGASAQPFLNEQVRIGLTAVEMTGRTPEGLAVTAQIVTPFTPSESLADTSALLTQIAPRHVLLVRVENTSARAVSGTVRVGLDGPAFDRSQGVNLRPWRLSGPLDALYFRDVSGGVAPNGTGPLRALAPVTGQAERFEDGPFVGLTRPFRLAAGTAHADTLVYAGHHGGAVLRDRKRNEDLRFYYTRFFADVDDVLAYARSTVVRDLARAAAFEQMLARSSATPEEKWTVALTFRNDLANALLLLDEGDEPRFYSLEGRFRHLSTVDVAHETELAAVFAPWRLRLQLGHWSEHVAWSESLGAQRGGEPVVEGIGAAEYGPYLYHDVGDWPFVSPTSDYTFGPYMAAEENANYALLLHWYWRLSGDDAFVRQRLGLLDVLMRSLRNRDTSGDGLPDAAFGWSTYDASEALKRAPENVYLGVKAAAAYVAAADLMRALAVRTGDSGVYAPGRAEGQTEDVALLDGNGAGFRQGPRPDNAALRERQAADYEAWAATVAATVEAARQRYGYVPVSLDESQPGWEQRSVVLGEGLMLPGLAGLEHPTLDRLAAALAPGYDAALAASTRPYGVALSSDEPDSWFSKIMASDLVASYWYDRSPSSARFTYAANRDNDWAYNDGMDGPGERWIGQWYPRGVSSLGYLFRETGWTAADRDAFLADLRVPTAR